MRTLIDRLCAGLAATIVLSCPQAVCAQWSDLGLSGREVAQLRLSDGRLYACTSDGLHRKVSDTVDSSWVLLGFAGERVHDVLAVSPETLVVAREVTGAGADTVALWRSTDGGVNWNPYQNGLGAGGTSIERKVVVLLEPPGAPGTILAAAWSGINKSTDGGLSWKKVSSAYRHYFLVSGATTLWAGGSGAAFTPFVRRSTNAGETWTFSFGAGNDDVAFDMAFDPADPNVAFLGLGNALHRTADNGVSWNPIALPPYGGASTLGARSFAPLRLYANAQAPPGGASFVKSDDGGSSWSAVSFPGAGSDWEQRILVRSGPAADTLFLGMGSGVLRYVELELVGVDGPVRESQLELHVSPNPADAATVVTFSLPKALHVSLRVLDSCGREMATLLSWQYEAGAHRFVWNHRGLPSGIYFLQLRAGSHVATRGAITVR